MAPTTGDEHGERRDLDSDEVLREAHQLTDRLTTVVTDFESFVSRLAAMNRREPREEP